MLPVSIDIKLKQNNLLHHSTVAEQMTKENTALLDKSDSFTINLSDNERILIGT